MVLSSSADTGQILHIITTKSKVWFLLNPVAVKSMDYPLANKSIESNFRLRIKVGHLVKLLVIKSDFQWNTKQAEGIMLCYQEER